MDEAVGCVGALAFARAFAFDPADFTVWRRPRRVDGLHDVRPDPLCILERLGEDADLNARAPRTLVALQMLRSRRSEEHTSELQSLMRISYAVFCLKKKTETNMQLTSDTKN